MQDGFHFIDLAEKCRRFALGADQLTSDRLLKLAAEYIARADLDEASPLEGCPAPKSGAAGSPLAAKYAELSFPAPLVR
jgi:hypothetical protein